MKKVLALFPNPEILEDNDLWTNRVRFGGKFIVGRSRPGGFTGIGGVPLPPQWGCSCPTWISRRTCEHTKFIEAVGNK